MIDDLSWGGLVKYPIDGEYDVCSCACENGFSIISEKRQKIPAIAYRKTGVIKKGSQFIKNSLFRTRRMETHERRSNILD